MRSFLLLLSALCALRVHCFFEGTCLRKDPPPGVLVLSPGSELVLTCRGHAKVDGVKVAITTESSNTNREKSSLHATPANVSGRDRTGHNGDVLVKRDIHGLEDPLSEGCYTHSTEAGVNTVTGEKRETVTKNKRKTPEIRQLTHTDRGHTVPSTSPTLQPTSASRPVEDEYDWQREEDDYEEGSRVTRGLRTRPQWKLNGRTLQPGERNSGEILFESRGSTLFLPSVRATDSGKYSCHSRGRVRSSFKVVVADPPERPRLSCYKKSPSSKIRCQWSPQQPVSMQPSCYLLLSKQLSFPFSRHECSYSPRLSRCWCALDYNEEEQRLPHMVYLCVTSAAGNATSDLLEFAPWSILKPDPPSALAVQQEEGQEKRLTVTWGFPSSWKSQDRFYRLIFEIRYQPIQPLGLHGSQHGVNERYYFITDALPGVEYMIQVRAKDEYDGLWSDWSEPVYARSWTALRPTVSYTTTNPVYDDEVSGDGDGMVTDRVVVLPPGDEEEVWQVVLWICGSFVLLSLLLAPFIFRHKDRLVSKLQSLSVATQCSDCSHPPPTAPTPREGQALVTFGPPRYKEPLPNEAEEEEEEEEEKEENEMAEERREAMHFNNTSYFLVQREC